MFQQSIEQLVNSKSLSLFHLFPSNNMGPQCKKMVVFTVSCLLASFWSPFWSSRSRALQSAFFHHGQMTRDEASTVVGSAGLHQKAAKPTWAKPLEGIADLQEGTRITSNRVKLQANRRRTRMVHHAAPAKAHDAKSDASLRQMRSFEWQWWSNVDDVWHVRSPEWAKKMSSEDITLMLGEGGHARTLSKQRAQWMSRKWLCLASSFRRAMQLLTLHRVIRKDERAVYLQSFRL